MKRKSKKSNLKYYLSFILFCITMFSFSFLNKSAYKDLSNEIFNSSVDEKINVNVYLPTQDMQYLKLQQFELKNSELRLLIGNVVEIIREKHKILLNIDYEIMNIYLDDSDCYLLLKVNRQNSMIIKENQLIFIYSLVNSLTNLGIKRIKFLGQNSEMFGNLNISQFFTEDKSLVI